MLDQLLLEEAGACALEFGIKEKTQKKNKKSQSRSKSKSGGVGSFLASQSLLANYTDLGDSKLTESVGFDSSEPTLEVKKRMSNNSSVVLKEQMQHSM